jgi:hypothetical protein
MASKIKCSVCGELGHNKTTCPKNASGGGKVTRAPQTSPNPEVLVVLPEEIVVRVRVVVTVERGA